MGIVCWVVRCNRNHWVAGVGIENNDLEISRDLTVVGHGVRETQNSELSRGHTIL